MIILNGEERKRANDIKKLWRCHSFISVIELNIRVEKLLIRLDTSTLVIVSIC